MTSISQKFKTYMSALPHRDYGDARCRLMDFMGWSYWQYNRRLNGDVFIRKPERDKIEQFFNEKIF